MQVYAQYPLSWASAVHELRTSKCTNWVLKRQNNQRPNCQHWLDHGESKVIPEKHFYCCFIDSAKPLTVWMTTNCGKLLERWGYQITFPVSWEICLQVKKQQLETDMEQLTGSKLGKEDDQGMYCHPAYLISMQNTSSEMLSWMNHKMDSRFLREISTTSDRQMVLI